MRNRRDTGSATVEHTGLALLVALLMAGAVAVVGANPPEREARELGVAIARKIRCAPQAAAPCWRDPLTEAYGRSLGGVVRALAPEPVTIPEPGGGALLPVDFRYCRSASCALPGDRVELTASNRRVTAFVALVDERRSLGTVLIDYWLYRPTLGWERVRREATAADVAAHAKTPLLESDNPRLVPLETFAGRNHVRFARWEEPPWRWKVESVFG